jgi:hypothetical protein
MKTTSIPATLLLGVALLAAGCSSTGESEFEPVVARSSQAFTHVLAFSRPSIHDFSPSERTTLANAILDFITQPVLDEHRLGHDWHHPSVGELFFSRHHDYLNQLENYLVNNGYDQFVPVPKWDPAEPIPDEFMVADPLVTQTPMDQFVDRPLPPEFTYDRFCRYTDLSVLAAELEGYHDDVHVDVGGAMGSVPSAPGAPIFWLWHGFLDDIYHDQPWRCKALPAIVSIVL